MLTGDALFCPTAPCEQILAAGGDYLLRVKENQGALYRDIALLCDPPPTVPAAPLSDRRAAHTLENGHGRTGERRDLAASTDLNDDLAWPGAAQVFRLERTWREHGKPKRTPRYGITSLPPEQADAALSLLHRAGGHRVASRLRAHSQRPEQAVALVLGPLPPGA